MSNQKEEQQEQKSLGTFAQRALRGRQGALENSIAQQLVAAAFCTDPTKKTSHICSAAMATEGVLKIKGLDLELMKQIYRVNQDLSGSIKYKFRIDNFTIATAVVVNWSFENSEQNFNDYIKPWYIKFDFWRQLIKMHRRKVYILKHRNGFYNDCSHVFGVYLKEELEEAEEKLKGQECPECYSPLSGGSAFTTEETTVVDANPFWSFFFEASQYLSEQGYGLLCNAFYAYAVPLAIKASSIMLKTISPSTYEDALKFLSGNDKEAELESEGSLDQTPR